MPENIQLNELTTKQISSISRLIYIDELYENNSIGIKKYAHHKRDFIFNDANLPHYMNHDHIFDRAVCRLRTRLRLNRVNNNIFKSYLDPSQSPFCSFCHLNVYDTIQHILFEVSTFIINVVIVHMKFFDVLVVNFLCPLFLVLLIIIPFNLLVKPFYYIQENF